MVTRECGGKLIDEMMRKYIMIWGCISARGVDNIHSIDGIMVKYVHNDILKKNVKQSIIKTGMSYIYMFQQENNSKHTLSQRSNG